MDNHIHYKVYGEITYLFLNFNGVAVDVWECISNFIKHFTEHVINCYRGKWRTYRITARVLGKAHIALQVFHALLWRHNGGECVSNHQPHDCLLNRLFGRWSKKTSKLGVTGLCAGNSPETDEFPAQMASNAENVSIWWRHHGTSLHVIIKSLRPNLSNIRDFLWLFHAFTVCGIC